MGARLLGLWLLIRIIFRKKKMTNTSYFYKYCKYKLNLLLFFKILLIFKKLVHFLLKIIIKKNLGLIW